MALHKQKNQSHYQCAYINQQGATTKYCIQKGKARCNNILFRIHTCKSFQNLYLTEFIEISRNIFIIIHQKRWFWCILMIGQICVLCKKILCLKLINLCINCQLISVIVCNNKLQLPLHGFSLNYFIKSNS